MSVFVHKMDMERSKRCPIAYSGVVESVVQAYTVASFQLVVALLLTGTGPAAIMHAALQNAKKSEEDEKENEDAVTKVLKALGASITHQHSRSSPRNTLVLSTSC